MWTSILPFGSLSFAGTPVVHDTDAATALALAASRIGALPEAEPVPYEALRSGSPTLQSRGAVIPCAGPPVAAGQVAETIDSVVPALLYGELERARALVEQARAQAACATGPVAGSELARTALLAGIGAELERDPARARERFAAALVLDPDTRWLDAFAPELRLQFDAAAAAVGGPTVGLSVVPPIAATLDGGPVERRVAPGEHLVQVGGAGVWVTLESPEDVVTVPAAFPPDGLSWIADPDQRPALSALLSARLGEGRSAVVVYGDAVYAGTTGRADWIAHLPPVGTTEVTPDPRRGGRWVPPVVAAVGAAIAGGGGVLAGVSIRQAGNAATDGAEAGNEGQYQAARVAWNDATRRGTWGFGAVAAGSVAAVTGVTWTFALRN